MLSLFPGGTKMLNQTTRNLLAAIQAIVGWEWLMSGGNKLLSGTFPQGLAETLTTNMKGNPNGWYVTFLQQIILPHSVFYGYLIEWTEVAIGILLVSGVLVLLGRPRLTGEPQHYLAVAYSWVVALAAAVAIAMTVNFHFLMGGWVLPAFDPTAANGEGIDLDALLPPFSLVIIIAHMALIRALKGGKLWKGFADLLSADKEAHRRNGHQPVSPDPVSMLAKM